MDRIYNGTRITGIPGPSPYLGAEAEELLEHLLSRVDESLRGAGDDELTRPHRHHCCDAARRVAVGTGHGHVVVVEVKLVIVVVEVIGVVARHVGRRRLLSYH